MSFLWLIYILTVFQFANGKTTDTTQMTTTEGKNIITDESHRSGKVVHLNGNQTTVMPIVIPDPTCWKLRGYRSRQKCLIDCGKVIAQPSKATGTPSPPMSHKVIHFNKTEYQIKDKQLHVLSPIPNSFRIFNDEDFFVSQNGTAYVCHPLTSSFMNCEKWVLEPHEYKIFENGSLLSIIHNEIYNFGEYFVHKGNRAVTCVSKEHAAPNEERDATLLVPWIISAISLTMALLFACLLPKLNLKHNVVLLCHMASLLAAYIAMIIRWIMEKHFPNVSCTAITLIQQYAFLTAFFWISVQSFDLWRRFVHPPANQGLRIIDKKKVIIYCIYAFGSPFILVLITLILEKSNVQSFKPFADGLCWFRNDTVALLFFYGPIAIILLANLFFFGLTIYQVQQMGKNATNINKQLNRQLLHLYAKLVIVMGLCWIMEVISWGVGGNSKAWTFTDVINSLQGFFIFLVYVIKSSLIRHCLKITGLETICNRYCSCCCPGQKKMDFEHTRATDTSTANISMEALKIRASKDSTEL